VRGTLGRSARTSPRINVSSCSFVVTLHGGVGDDAEKERIERCVRAVRGVQGVINRLRAEEP
jgi:osmotically-inducible protein OsmY